jgi:hypothetical protein
MISLTNQDYQTILNFYKISFSSYNANQIKEMAEDILANKLCRCIKKVQKKNNLKKETKAIAICKNSVLKKKNIYSSTFKCKPKARFVKNKKTKKKIYKKNKKPLKKL